MDKEELEKHIEMLSEDLASFREDLETMNREDFDPAKVVGEHMILDMSTQFDAFRNAFGTNPEKIIMTPDLMARYHTELDYNKRYDSSLTLVFKGVEIVNSAGCISFKES